MNRSELKDDLPLCGCGNPRAGAQFILSLLRLSPFYDHQDELKALLPDEGLRMFVLGVIDEKCWIEHGGTIEGSWLTARGREVRTGLELEFERDRFLSMMCPTEVPPDQAVW